MPTATGETAADGLRKRAVKACVVRNDQLHTIEQFCNTRLIQSLTLHHVGSYPGDFLYLARDGHAGVFQLVIHLHASNRLPGRQVYIHTQKGQLHDFVFGVVQAGGLSVQHHHAANTLAGGGGPLQTGLQPPQNPVIRMRVQRCSHLLCTVTFRRHWRRRWHAPPPERHPTALVRRFVHPLVRWKPGSPFGSPACGASPSPQEGPLQMQNRVGRWSKGYPVLANRQPLSWARTRFLLATPPMTTQKLQPTSPKPLQPLKGVRILSLALNLPGPAAP